MQLFWTNLHPKLKLNLSLVKYFLLKMSTLKHKRFAIISFALTKQTLVSVLFFFLFFLSPFFSFSQRSIFTDQPSRRETTKISEADKKKMLERREELIKKGMQFKTTERTRTGNPLPPVPLTSCGNLGVESGWSLWQGAIGDASFVNSPTIAIGAPGAPTAPRFNITTGTGSDICTPGPNVGDPTIPLVAPGFGTASLQLGETATNGSSGGCNYGCVEQATYPFAVTAQDTSFIYAYALVYEFPSSGHLLEEAPFAEIYMLAANGDTVPCTHVKYVADVTGSNTIPPGMFQALPCGDNGNDVVYKPWTVVGVNLSSYVGQTVTVVIINADCALGGHFCHSYWDFQCNTLLTTNNPICFGQQNSLCAPASDPLNPYTYQWYHNNIPFNPSNQWTPVPGGTTQCINVSPIVGDTFIVHVMQQSGCNFYLPIVPEITGATANFIYSGSCGTLNFTDSSFVTPSSNTNVIASWNWQFPGGVPASSALQIPGTITYAPGSHVVTLIVTSTAGCIDTIVKTITFHNNPIALFNETDSGCMPVCHQFIDSSFSAEPITSWNWSFPGGVPSSTTSANPEIICYNAPGDYGASLIVSTGFCLDTIQLNNIIHVYDWPTADFCVDKVSSTVANPLFNFCKQWSSDVVKFRWNFGDGSPIDSTSQNPAHSYAPSVINNDFYSFPVCIYVENIHGCFDTICHTVEMTPDFDFYIPNCFTPNGNEVNDLFYAKTTGVKKYHIWIFDRWGNNIYECKYEGSNTTWDHAEGMSSACKWDGIVQPGGPDMSGDNGEVSLQDVYVWKVVLTDIFEKVHNYIGTVTIVK